MLIRKMLRDLRENKGAYIACITIVIIGLMIYTSFAIVTENLNLSQDTFYSNQNFADGFAEVKAMPLAQIEKLNAIEGIDRIEGRLVKDVRVLFPGRKENIYLRLISVELQRDNPINGVLLDRGIPLNNEEMNIWLDNKFFEANKLELNQNIEIIAAGKKRSLQVVGVGKNPEFIYALRTAGELFPRPEEFGIAYLPYEVMKTLFSEKDTVNSIVFTLKPGTEFTAVEDELKPKLQAYGLRSIYARKDQTSHVMLSEELENLKKMGQSLPVVFLAVAGMILYIMLKRMVEQQRGQIGIMKALGYSNKEIMLHYMSYAITIGLLGGIVGSLLGIALSKTLTAMYQVFFNMPGMERPFSPWTLFFSIILSLSFSIFAGYRGCKGALILSPAQAMRPPSPPLGKKVILEKITVFWNMLTVQGKMAGRNIFRHPGRSVFVLLGIMFTFALLSAPFSMWEVAEKMLYDQFEKVETYDVKISLASPLSQKEIERELSRFPGVNKVESKIEAPAVLKNKWYKKELVILGLPAKSSLHRILDSSGRQIEPPENGILVSERLAQLLKAGIGTKVSLESPLQKDPQSPLQIEIAGIIPQQLGLNAYMEINALQDLLGQGDFATSVMVDIDPGCQPLLEEQYKNAAAISSLDDRNHMLAQMKEMMATYSGTIYIFLIMGAVVGFAIIYNSSIITLSERSRELASMMVLGMTPSEVLSVVTFEQWFIAVFGMLAGIPLSKLLLTALAQSTSNDMFTMPSELSFASIVAGFVAAILSIWIAQRVAARKINKLQIADVLKAGE